MFSTAHTAHPHFYEVAVYYRYGEGESKKESRKGGRLSLSKTPASHKTACEFRIRCRISRHCCNILPPTDFQTSSHHCLSPSLFLIGYSLGGLGRLPTALPHRFLVRRSILHALVSSCPLEQDQETRTHELANRGGTKHVAVKVVEGEAILAFFF